MTRDPKATMDERLVEIKHEALASGVVWSEGRQQRPRLTVLYMRQIFCSIKATRDEHVGPERDGDSKNARRTKK
jgi:hypothetical protein